MRQLIKKLLPNSVLNKIKSAISYSNQTIQSFFAQSPFLARLYFSFFNSSYQREQFATLQGMQTYKKRIKSTNEQSNPLLRRNIHRLEKGLIMQPLKAVFALDYIEETQQAYILACRTDDYQQQELDWTKAVLAKFYLTVQLEQSVLLTNLAREFDLHSDTDSIDSNKLTPYKNSELIETKLTYQQLADFLQVRRSTRWFKQKNVCHEKIKKAVDIASQAPSACNRQPYEFYVVDKQPLLSKISKLAIGSGGFAHNIPSLVVLIGDYSHYMHERDRHIIYIDASLAAMQFMQALPTLGLSSCPLNWPELSTVDKKITKLLKLPEHKKTIMLIAVGEADVDGRIPYSQKKSAEELIHFVK